MVSKLDKRCANCKHRDNCNNKRMCGLAYIDVKNVDINKMQQNFQVDINIEEEIKKSLTKELRCGFRGF